MEVARRTESLSESSVLLYTGIIGNYDDLREIPFQTMSLEALCFTDQPLKSESWRITNVDRMFPADPVMSARYLKLGQGLSDYELCVYLDASFEILRSDFVEFLVGHLHDHEMVMLQHPHRSCLFQEIDVCRTMPRFNRQPLRRQRLRYKLAGMPKNYGLWATGCFAFKNNESTVQFRNAWWKEITQTSNRDQISLPYMMRCSRFLEKTKTLNLDIFDNPYIKWRPHNL